jgi:hypothetical protein
MKRFYLIGLILLTININSNAQVNLVVNPSFEELYGCPTDFYQIDSAIGWHTPINGGGGNPDLYNTCSPQSTNVGVPTNYYNRSFQIPHSGNGYAGIDVIASFNIDNAREYIQNQLIRKLIVGAVYCVKFYVNLIDYANASIRTLGAYLDDGSVYASTFFGIANATPQVYNSNVQLNDKINWIKIEGSFIAIGNEEYITIGNYFTDAESDTSIIGLQTLWWSYYYIDDVSVIDADLNAYAGKDTIIHNKGDSVFIGRPSEVGLDEDCIWFVNSVPIDTIAGMWVKLDTTTTYVLQQTICGIVKYDTVTITVSGVGIERFDDKVNYFKIYPNPASEILNIECNCEIAEIIIMDVTGQILIDKNPNKANTTIDLKGLAKGIYFTKVISNHQTWQGKFLKE